MTTNYLYLKKWIKTFFNVENLKQFIFYLLLFLIPFQTSKHFFIPEAILNGKIIDYFLPTIYIQDILIVLFVFISFFLFLKNHDFKRLSLYQKIIVTIILLLIPFFLIFNLQYLRDKIFIIKYLRIIEFSLFIITILIQKKKFINFNRIAIILSISSFLLSLVIIGEFLLQRSIGFNLLGEWNFNSSDSGLATFYFEGFKIIRPRATFPHPNIAAFYLSLVSFLNLYLFIFKKQKQGFIIFFFNTIAIILLFSKIGYLLFLISIVIFSSYFSFTYRDKVATRLSRKTKLLTLFIFITLIIISSLFILRTNSLLVSDYPSLERRFFLNEIAVRSIKNNLTTGVGLNRFLMQFNSEDFSNLYSFVQPVHNFYLLFIAENGFFLFLLFMFIFLYGLFLQINLFIDKNQNFFRLFLIMFFVLFIITSFWDHYFYSLFQGNLITSFFLALSLFYRE